MGTSDASADLSKPTQHAAALERSAAHAPVALCQFKVLPDGQFRVLFVTDLVERVLGVDPTTLMRELDADWLAERMHPQDWAEFLDEMEAMDASDESFDHMFRFREAPSQPWRWIRSTAALEQRDQDRVWHGALQDVSGIMHERRTRHTEAELRQAKQEAEAAVQAKSEFVARMSHELRTPLSGILGITELMTRSPLTEEQHEYCDIIAASGRTLLSIINEVLDFTRGEEGKLDHQSGPFDLYEVLFGAAKMLIANAGNAGLDLAVHYPPDAPRIFVGDARKLRQIALNLIGNAIKFTDAGYVVVRVTVADPVGTSSKVRVEVCDTGVGIPPIDQDRLFEAFTQLPNQHHTGTGLGLAICRHFVESMGGTIGVESTVGVGSTFWFELDLPRFDDSASEVTMTSLADQRIVVVDDCPAIRHLVEDYLAHAGACVLSFATVGQAVAALEQDFEEPIDAILMAHYAMGERLVDLIEQGQSKRPARIGLHGRSARETTPSLEQPVHINQLLATVGAALESKASHAQATHDRELRYTRTRPVTDPRIKRIAQPRRVLLVEDDPINCTVVTRMLETLSCTVTHAPDGPDAVAAAQDADFELILMDCQLPTFTGIEATRRIRQLDSRRTTHLPILALSANVMPEFRQACIDAGMDDFLLKPVNRDQLSRAHRMVWSGVARRGGLRGH